jgi:plasmid stability protein
MNEDEAQEMLTVQVPASMKERLRARAKANHRTVSQEIRKLIDESFAEDPNGDNKVAA